MTMTITSGIRKERVSRFITRLMYSDPLVLSEASFGA